MIEMIALPYKDTTIYVSSAHIMTVRVEHVDYGTGFQGEPQDQGLTLILLLVGGQELRIRSDRAQELAEQILSRTLVFRAE